MKQSPWARSPADVRAEEEARRQSLYGPLLSDVDLLRKRGFTVIREGDAYRVDNRLRTAAEVRDLARREANLMKPASAGRVVATVSGLRGGGRVNVASPPPRTPPAPAARQAGGASPRPAAPAPPVRPPASPPAIAARPLSGAAAIARARASEHSTELGTKPRVVWLDLGLLTVDRRYQREIAAAGLAHVHRILKAFNWNCYQPIVVTERPDGSYAVIDGQHRLEAARKHPLIDSLPCYIIDAPDVAAEARIFATVNSGRLALTAQQKYWAAHAAGESTAVAVHRLCEAAGVTILRSPPSGAIPPLSLLAPMTLVKLLGQVGGAALGQALKLLAEAHPAEPNVFRSPTIAALARIIAGPAFSEATMRQALARTRMDRLYDTARQERIASGGTLATATERVLRMHYGAAAGEDGR